MHARGSMQRASWFMLEKENLPTNLGLDEEFPLHGGPFREAGSMLNLLGGA